MKHSEHWQNLYNLYWKNLVRIPRYRWYVGKNITGIPLVAKPIPRDDLYDGMTEEQREQFLIHRERAQKQWESNCAGWLIESRNNKNVELGDIEFIFHDAETRKLKHLRIENCDVKETLQIIGILATGKREYYVKASGFVLPLDAALLKAESNCLYFATYRRSFELHFHEGTTYTIYNKKTKTIDATTPSNPEFENKIKRDELGRFATQNKSKEENEIEQQKENETEQKSNTNNSSYKEKQHNGIDIIDDNRAYDFHRMYIQACRDLKHQTISSKIFERMEQFGLQNNSIYRFLKRLQNKQNDLKSSKYIKNLNVFASKLDKEQLKKSVEALSGYGKEAQHALKKIYSLKDNVIDKYHKQFDFPKFIQENYWDMIEEGLYTEDDFESRDCFIEYVEQNLKNPFLIAIYCFSSVADRKFELNNNNMYKALECMIDNSPFETADLFRGNSLSVEIFNQLKPGMSFKDINRQKLEKAPNDFNITNASYNYDIAQEFMQKQYDNDKGFDKLTHYRVMHIFPNSKHIVGKHLSQYGHEEEVYCKMDDKIIDKIYKDGDNVIILYKNKKNN